MRHVTQSNYSNYGHKTRDATQRFTGTQWSRTHTRVYTQTIFPHVRPDINILKICMKTRTHTLQAYFHFHFIIRYACLFHTEKLDGRESRLSFIILMFYFFLLFTRLPLVMCSKWQIVGIWKSFYVSTFMRSAIQRTSEWRLDAW